jgi:hypothetical protein
MTAVAKPLGKAFCGRCFRFNRLDRHLSRNRHHEISDIPHLLTRFSGGSRISLNTFDLPIPIADLYENIDFSEP